jgi:ABC-type nitrate/sulfonate/bicarbonate transport system permease component
MMDPIRGKDDEMLDALFQAYRRACPTPEPSANFMPTLWQRIESRQTFTFSLRRMANAFVTAALAMSIALGVYMMVIPRTQTTTAMSYIEVLAESRPLDTPDFVTPVNLDLADHGR